MVVPVGQGPARPHAPGDARLDGHARAVGRILVRAPDAAGRSQQDEEGSRHTQHLYYYQDGRIDEPNECARPRQQQRQQQHAEVVGKMGGGAAIEMGLSSLLMGLSAVVGWGCTNGRGMGRAPSMWMRRRAVGLLSGWPPHGPSIYMPNNPPIRLALLFRGERRGRMI